MITCNPKFARSIVFNSLSNISFNINLCCPYIKEVIKDLRSRIAPAIYGSDDIKAAVCTLLFSGSRQGGGLEFILT